MVLHRFHAGGAPFSTGGVFGGVHSRFRHLGRIFTQGLILVGVAASLGTPRWDHGRPLC